MERDFPFPRMVHALQCLETPQTRPPPKAFLEAAVGYSPGASSELRVRRSGEEFGLEMGFLED
jgi:hypothetical protein